MTHTKKRSKEELTTTTKKRKGLNRKVPVFHRNPAR